MKTWKTIKETAENLGVSKTTIRKFLTPEFRKIHTRVGAENSILIDSAGYGIIEKILKNSKFSGEISKSCFADFIHSGISSSSNNCIQRRKPNEKTENFHRTTENLEENIVENEMHFSCFTACSQNDCTPRRKTDRKTENFHQTTENFEETEKGKTAESILKVWENEKKSSGNGAELEFQKNDSSNDCKPERKSNEKTENFHRTTENLKEFEGLKNEASNPENNYLYRILEEELQEKSQQIKALQAELAEERQYSHAQADRILQLADQSQKLQLAQIAQQREKAQLDRGTFWRRIFGRKRS